MDTSQKNLYFVNPIIDYIFIGGVSTLTFVLMMLFIGNNYEVATIMTIVASLSWVCNNPHFAATTYRLYKSKQNMMQFPFTSFVVPFIVIAGIGASLYFPETVAPFFIKFFFIWSPFHFSGQSFGISMVYAKRAGYKMSSFERESLKVFIYSSFIAILFKVDMHFAESEHYTLKYAALNIPDWSYFSVLTIMCISGLIVFYQAYRWSKKNKKLLPPIVLLPAITHIVWFIGGSQHISFDAFVPFFHSAQYLFIAWAMQMKDISNNESQLEKITIKKSFIQTLMWFSFNCLVGAFMFEGIPLLFPYFNTSPLIGFGIVIAGVQIHHFFVDGVIWKLKDQSKKSALVVHISEYINTSAKLPEVKI